MTGAFRRTVCAVLCAAVLITVCASAFAAEESGKSFSDVKGHWAQAAIEKWSGQGIINGYPDGTFRPNNKITRAEFAVMMNRIMRLDGSGDYLYNVPKSAWYYADATALTSVRVLMARDGGAELATTYITREEVAYAVDKLLRLPLAYRDTNRMFNDADDISDWANFSVAALYIAGILRGYPDGRFAPKDGITRAELITLIDNAIEMYIGKPGEYTYTGSGRGLIFLGSGDVKLRIASAEDSAEPITVKVFCAYGLGVPEGVKIEVSDKNTVLKISQRESDLEIDAAHLKGWEDSGRLLLNRETAYPPQPYGGENDTELKMVALGGLLNYANNAYGRLFTYFSSPSDADARNHAQRVLASGWNVTNKETLAEKVLWLLLEGHNAQFLSDAAAIKGMSKEERAHYADAYLLDQTEAWSKKWGDTGIVAWDLCRVSNVLQWGYAAGYITKDEALAMGEIALLAAAELFDSWEELYDNYLDGYAWWSRRNVAEKGRDREDYWEALNGLYPDVFRDEMLK